LGTSHDLEILINGCYLNSDTVDPEKYSATSGPDQDIDLTICQYHVPCIFIGESTMHPENTDIARRTANLEKRQAWKKLDKTKEFLLYLYSLVPYWVDELMQKLKYKLYILPIKSMLQANFAFKNASWNLYWGQRIDV